MYDGKYSCQSQTLVVNVSLVWNLKPVWPFVTPERNTHGMAFTHTRRKQAHSVTLVLVLHTWVCVLRFTAPCWQNETSTLLPFLGVFLCGRALISSAHPSLISPDGFPCCSSFHWENAFLFICRIKKDKRTRWTALNFYFSSVRWFQVIIAHHTTGIFLISYACSEHYTKMTWIYFC